MIFEPLVRKGYEWINCYNDADYEIFLSLDGKPRAKRWKPVKVRRVRADKKQEFKPSDFPWLGRHALVMRRKAVEALHDILHKNGELLPLETDDKIELFVFNAKVIDGLDEKRSSIIRFPTTNRIMFIKKPVFKKDVIQGHDIFRLPYRASSTYVSQHFVERVKKTGLKGLEFKKV